MNMDMFERQDFTRKKSWQFIAAFIISGILAIFLIYLASAYGLMLSSFYFPYIYLLPLISEIVKSFIFNDTPNVLALKPVLVLGLPILTIILTVTFRQVKAIQDGGGTYIAQSLGANLLGIKPQDQKEMLLLNIVEEMAVASSLPMPLVYTLPNDSGINAMTAGMTPYDAVIIVTQGSLDLLTRDELQGVIAHEFGHIYNGDSSINCLMAGYLSGLMCFCVIGRSIFNESKYILDSELTLLHPFAVVLGTIIYASGLLGKWCAEIIQTAFSRQREYLADALAVQFTRNPSGLAGALKKIGGLRYGGFVRSGKAILFSPFFITSPTRPWSLLRTHPPLSSRIELLDPSWDGSFEALDYLPQLSKKKQESIKKMHQPFAFVKNSKRKIDIIDSASIATLAAWQEALPASMLASAGSKMPLPPSPLKALPPEIIASQDYAAIAIVAILHEKQCDRYPQQCPLSSQAKHLRPFITEKNRLPVLNYAFEHLKKNMVDHQLELKNIVNRFLLPVDTDSSFSDVAAYWMTVNFCGYNHKLFYIDASKSCNYIASIRQSIGEMLSVFAWQSACCEQEAISHYYKSFQNFLHWVAPELSPESNSTPQNLHQSLMVLSQASKSIKYSILTAALDTAIEDKKISQVESEYLWAVYSALN